MNKQDQVRNPKTQVPNSPQMNDRDFINDMLATEKYMTDAYSKALNEASHQTYYNDLLNIFNETQNCQRDLFNLMFKKGWYKLDAEQNQTLQQSYQQFQKYQNQFPYQPNQQNIQ